MVNSIVWSVEEAKYLKAIFRWQEISSADEESQKAAKAAERQRQREQKPAGEFRVLVLGGRGTGKTSLLTRFAAGVFHGESQPPDPFYERGCRHPITLEEVNPAAETTDRPSSHEKTATAAAAAAATTVTYVIDALEMPSGQLPSNPALAAALGLTEAAVLVYSVRDAASLRLARGLAEFVREHFSPPDSDAADANATNGSSNGGGGSGSAAEDLLRRRIYPVVLVGTKADFPPPSPSPSSTRRNGRAVSWGEGARAARGMGTPGADGVPFLEVSAKTGEGVDRVFELVAREVLRARRIAREKREAAERERMMLLGHEAGLVKTVGSEGRRKKFWLWKALFGRRAGGK
ncbi:ras-related and estrogen-regulated growth inhibitor-like protein [Corynascus novoguineensis]|uniref:Ras-related and estrogen-regulated growth inhibitor-like protein n=1 Tax=Corynascus novoguineensis TaxID=1126955 RepID=A0AAN7HK29_9PEZI|nr:ras-related and estrogen-regulated growth inhibitor-like protein [Corynascus novoguineensis]